MNSLIPAINEFADQWWAWVCLAGWQAAWVGIVILLVIWLGRRLPSPLRYSLLLIGVLKFIVPTSVVAPTSIWPSAAQGSTARARTSSATFNPVRTPPARVSNAAAAKVGTPAESEAPKASLTTAIPAAESGSGAQHHSLQHSLSLHAWLLLIAICGTALWALWLLGQWIALKRIEHRAEAAPKELQALLSGVCTSLDFRRRVKLLITSESMAPNACGLLHPKILMPSHLTALSDQELSCVLAHEVTHHQRGDILVNFGLWLIQAAWWFHPVAWLLGASARRVREECCDDRLLHSGIIKAEDYCDTLLRTVTFGAVSRESALAAGIGTHPLGRRFARILDTSLRRSSSLSIIGCLSIVTAAALVLPGATDPDRHLQETPNDAFFLSGVVVNHLGEAQAGVKLLYTQVMDQDFQLKRFHDAGVSDANGQFRIAIDRSTLNLPKAVPPAICAIAPGAGIAWHRAKKRETETEIKLVLAPELPVTGQILSLEGQPLSGVTVRPLKVFAPTDGNLDTWLAHVKAKTNRTFEHLRPRISLLPDMGTCTPVTTDAEGRFSLLGFSKDLVIDVLISGPKTEASIARLVSRRMPAFKARNWMGQPATHHGIPAQVLVAPTRLITGKVSDAKTGVPLQGIEVFPRAVQGYPRSYLRVRTDEKGIYTLAGLKINARPTIMTSNDFDRGYLSTEARAPKQTGTDPITLNLKLHRGITVEGQVRDDAGVPIAEAFVSHAPYLQAGDNNVANMAAVSETRTAPDGSYRIMAMPGSTVLRFRAGSEYLPLSQQETSSDVLDLAKKINASPGRTAALYRVNLELRTAPHIVNIVLRKGQDVVAKVVDESGKPVRGVSVYRRTNHRRWEAASKDEASITLKALNPKRPRGILAVHRERSLIGRLTIDANTKATIVMKPAGRITGTFVDVDGLPRAGKFLSLSARDEASGLEVTNAHPGNIKTNDAGEFEIPCCFPGFTYTIMTASMMQMMPGGMAKYLPPIEIGTGIKVKAGATTDLGSTKGRQL